MRNEQVMTLMRKLSLVFLLLISSLALADKYALLVGINDYQNDIGALKYCVADVEAFRQALIETAGFKPEKVHLMTDQMSGQDLPTRINVIMRLDILASQIQPQDTLIFYFSGHGISTDDQSFLLASDSNATTFTTLELSAIPLQKVRQILSRVKAQQLLTIIDACRNDPASGRGNQDNLLSDDFARGFKVQRQAGPSGKPAVSATLYACSVGERAYEWSEKEQGVFSYYLLQGLKGEAANAKGDVTITDLADYTQQKVVDWAQTYRGKKQTPWLSLQGGSKLVLAENVVEEAVKVDQPTEAVKVETVETKATLFVSSVPQGATVYINQQKMVEKTPAVLRIDTGISRQKEVEVGLELAGYETLIIKAELVGGQLVELKNLQLVKIEAPKSRRLVVNSHPPGAGVYLDGVLQSGQTPFSTKIDLRAHQLKLSLAGYQDWTHQIRTSADQSTASVQLSATLKKVKPLTGSLYISSNPKGARIFLGDKRQNQETPTTLKALATGLHSIKLTLSDYQDYQQQVTVEANQTTELKVDLVSLVPEKSEPRPVEAKKKGAKWPWIGGGLAVVGAGVAAFLFTGAEDEAEVPVKTTALNISVVIP
ncbi:MAG: PEGA domain-containing protein [Candidatus Poribacteria bacterium]|nr:PEGA domain-containing protein [Candidatus Poribacteria bacterium]